MMSPVTILNTNVGHMLASNSKTLLTEPMRNIVMDKKNRRGAYRILATAPTVWFRSSGEIQYWKPNSGGEAGAGVGPGQGRK